MVSESEQDTDIQRPDASSVSGLLQLSAIERVPPYLHLLQVGGQDSRPAAGKRGDGPSRSHGHRGRRGRGGQRHHDGGGQAAAAATLTLGHGPAARIKRQEGVKSS